MFCSQFKYERPNIVIPAQAGIQWLGFQELIGKGCYATVWIPACAGMTMAGIFFFYSP